MPATLETPVCTIPLPPGATEPGVFPVPKPDVLCSACESVPGEPPVEPDCKGCAGSGLLPALFRLSPARAHKYRHVCYAPGRKLLRITMATKPHTKAEIDEYSVQEVPCDGPGRLFVCAKLGTLDRTHEVYLGADGVSCSCEGHVYITTAKANQRAHDAGDEIYPGCGCRHSDALAALLRAGWLDNTEVCS